MLSLSHSTGPARVRGQGGVSRPSHEMKGIPKFAACAKILYKSEKSCVAPLACISADEANHKFLKFCSPMLWAPLAEWRGDGRECSLEEEA